MVRVWGTNARRELALMLAPAAQHECCCSSLQRFPAANAHSTTRSRRSAHCIGMPLQTPAARAQRQRSEEL
jgi:hypothetical protein